VQKHLMEVIKMAVAQVDRVQRMDIGLKRNMVQVQKTVKFELRRFVKKTFATIFFVMAIFVLFLVINEISESKGAAVPETTTDYILSYFSMMDFVIILIGMTFAGSIIAEDFEKHTGNLIFPKIDKNRLLIGRMVARFILASICLFTYYAAIAITTNIKYDTHIPIEIWHSFAWAELYLFSIMAFVTFFSSFMNRTATAMIGSFMFLFMVFNLISSIFMFTGVQTEPLFFLTYYGNIISACFDMPAVDERMIERPFSMGPGGSESGNSYYMWSTPSVVGALVGMILYSLILLISAYFLFKRRQNQAN
jgi:ABC-2 type transport system permease protein